MEQRRHAAQRLALERGLGSVEDEAEVNLKPSIVGDTGLMKRRTRLIATMVIVVSKKAPSSITANYPHPIMRSRHSQTHHLNSHHPTLNPLLPAGRSRQRGMELPSQSLPMSQASDSYIFNKSFDCIIQRFSVTTALGAGFNRGLAPCCTCPWS